ncbi:IclR family transcriptional regulator [Pseudolysinimonas sp.]|uniref:IclR family transcriptional regulator n=1 Tax=Pseudolysinimonas sp. TaxID=2680009 RepID=UPI00286A3A57|nr:IclR family transcriptional regulator [Pseudolysinimonas sp.]
MASIPGIQVIGRAAAVLRAVSTAMPRGLSTSAVATATGLARPTAHRLLASLAAEGFLDHDALSSRWVPGPELYLLGAVAAERYDITATARPVVRALAEATGESAFLSARRGDETVCLLREDGAFPIRSHVLHEGIRFPLGVASAGLAILAFLPDVGVERYLASADLSEFGTTHDPARVRERVAATRTAGYAVNPGLLVEGSWGMGAAVFDTSGQPAWALSLTGIEARFSADRRPELGRLLLEHAHRLTQALRGR